MIKKILTILLIALTFLSFSNVYAELTNMTSFDLNNSSSEGNQILNKIVTKTGQSEVTSVPTIFNRFIKIFLGISSSIFLIFLVVGGFKYLGSKGNITEIGESLSLVKTGAIGLAVILLAYSITSFVLSQINNIGR